MREPTMTRAPPVAHEGMEAKIGAKKTETKKANPVTQAVIPVLPPSEGRTTVYGKLEQLMYDSPEMPVALSMKAVTGEVPIKAPILMEKASMQYAMVEFSKSNVTGSLSPANLAMEYKVLDVIDRYAEYQMKRKNAPSGVQDIDIEESNECVPHSALPFHMFRRNGAKTLRETHP
jgi:hypothetical protein